MLEETRDEGYDDIYWAWRELLPQERARGREKDIEALLSVISEVLTVQVTFAGGHLRHLATSRGAKALGYVYGFCDAALRTFGKDMSDPSQGVSFTFRVLSRDFPDSAEQYLNYISKKGGKDAGTNAGVMLGGNSTLIGGTESSRCPWDLRARCPN